ncbi:MAG: U32 family peptidase [Paludibacteraceae bacterium]|nr:U32 family peptidase [Paludibacteraceae bacterium]
MSEKQHIELMAPAGTWECLSAAINSGADAVYFGIESLNMRARSTGNFTTADLPRLVETCQNAGVKSYLTVNTVIYQDDLQLMRQIIDEAKRVGVSAIIASDIAVMQYCNAVGVEVHLSTQLNIANSEALRFYAQFADVVVLARELNLEQVAQIARTISDEHITGRGGNPIRIEMFCHGALCMAVSGKCYLSLHEGNSSANRGACMQVCRRRYLVKDYDSDIELEIGNPYIMSPKDLKTIHFLNKMLDAGVRVLKIEGRARGPEYVATVTKCYREAIDAWRDGTYSDEKINDWNERLATVFNRGFWNGYYLGQRLGEWTSNYGSQATKRKVYVAKCTNFFKKAQVAEFLVESGKIAEGQQLLITGETTGAVELVAEGLRNYDEQPVKEVLKGNVMTIRVPGTIRRGDRLYLLEDTGIKPQTV